VSTSTPAVPLERVAQRKPVLGEDVGVALAEHLQQPRLALDVGEEERHRAARQRAHQLDYCAGHPPPARRWTSTGQ